MYTEIKEAVNFHAKYLLGRIPRRTVSLFAQELANLLVNRYIEIWHEDEPTKDEMNRSIYIRYTNITDKLITTAAQSVGMDTEELLSASPESIILFVNPGQVYYKCNERATPCFIWHGDVKQDDHYMSLPAHALQPQDRQDSTASSNMGAAGKTVYCVRPMSNALSTESAPPVEDAYIPLQLEPIHPATIDSPLNLDAHASLKQFTFVAKDHKTYQVEEFAVTRFGSHRTRPDHDVMRRIQQQAGMKAAEVPSIHIPMSSALNGAGDGHSMHALMPQSLMQPQLPSNSENLRQLSVEERNNLISMLTQLNVDAERSHQQLPAFQGRSFGRPPVSTSYVQSPMSQASVRPENQYSQFMDSRQLQNDMNKRWGAGDWH